MTAATGPRHAAARLLVLVLWAAAGFVAPAAGLVGMGVGAGVLAARQSRPLRRQWGRAVVRFTPWALFWGASAWWATGFSASGAEAAVQTAAGTWIAVAGAEHLLPGLLPGEVYGVVYEALAALGHRLAEDAALAAAMMVRFVPLLRAEWRGLQWGLEARDPGRGFRARLARAAATVVPLLARALGRTEEMALVLWLKRPPLPAARARWQAGDWRWVVGCGVWVGLMAAAGREGWLWPWR